MGGWTKGVSTEAVGHGTIVGGVKEISETQLDVGVDENLCCRLTS